MHANSKKRQSSAPKIITAKEAVEQGFVQPIEYQASFTKQHLQQHNVAGCQKNITTTVQTASAKRCLFLNKTQENDLNKFYSKLLSKG